MFNQNKPVKIFVAWHQLIGEAWEKSWLKYYALRWLTFLKMFCLTHLTISTFLSLTLTLPSKLTQFFYLSITHTYLTSYKLPPPSRTSITIVKLYLQNFATKKTLSASIQCANMKFYSLIFRKVDATQFD